jgi:photosystem II stability/assembly factor-like uncharacterized protein
VGSHYSVSVGGLVTILISLWVCLPVRAIDPSRVHRKPFGHFSVLNGPLGAPQRGLNEPAEEQSLIPLFQTGPEWLPLGPSPIPNGQTEPPSPEVPVSGRVTAIAVDPTDPNLVYVGGAQGGVYRSFDGGETWTQLFVGAKNFAIGCITIDPVDSNNVFVGTGEGNLSADSYYGVGVYVIRNAKSAAPLLEGPYNLDTLGKNVFFPTSIESIVVDPNNDNIVFVATSAGFGGLAGNFGAPTNDLPPWGLYRSKDFLTGQHRFERLNVGSGTNSFYTSAVMDPTNPNHLVLALFGLSASKTDPNPDGGLYYTENALAPKPKFTKVTGLPETSNGNLPLQTNVKLAFSADGLTVLAATGELDSAQTDQGVLRQSTDGGKTFPTILHKADGFAGGQGFYNIAVAIDQKNPLNVYLAGTVGSSGDGGIFQYSADGGQTFTPSINSLHADSHAIAIAPSASNVIYTGDDGGIWGSNDSGRDWTDLNTEGFIATQFESVVVHPIDSNYTLGGTQDNGTILRKPDGTFFRVDFGDGGYALIDQSATDAEHVTLYHTYFNQTGNLIGFARVLKTSCAVEGEWSFRGAYPPPIDPTVHCDGTKDKFNGINLNDNVNFYAPMTLGPGTPNTVYFGTDTLYRSADKGDTMPAVSQAPIEKVNGASVPISAIGISPTSDSIRVVGLDDGTVWATTTGSPTLTQIDGGKLPADYICRVVLDPIDPNTVYVTFNGYGLTAKPGEQIWVTHNLNAATPTWKPAGKGIPSISVNGFVVDPLNTKHLFAGTDHGVYASVDGGAHWSQFGKGFPDVEIFDLTLQSPARILRGATHGLGIWEASIGF